MTRMCYRRACQHLGSVLHSAMSTRHW